MRRRVLYDPESPAAAAAAALLADEFDVSPWTAADAKIAAILRPSPPARPATDAAARVIGVVDPMRTEAWPASWYALIPAATARPLVARAVANAFADLDAEADRRRLERELGELNAIGIQLSAERDLDVLLDTILTKAREITRSDAGSLYLVEEAPGGERRLRFALAQN